MSNFQIVKILIEKGADVNAQNNKKEAPLFDGLFIIQQGF